MKTLALKGFVELKTLGKGTYGEVYKARRECDGQIYAVKVVHLRSLSPEEIQQSVNEIRIMASFTSPFILRFYESFCDSKRLILVMEYCRLGDLRHLIARKRKKERSLKESVIWCYLLQIVEGLRALHAAGVVHRDLKSANILVAAPDLAKIADLGVSTVLRTNELARTQIGTPLYLAPEVWRKRPYDHKCDMWAVGILLYEMMTFSFPFIDKFAVDIGHLACRGRYTLPQGEYSSDLVSVVRALLQVDPASRPTVNDLLQMPCVHRRRPLLDRLIGGEITGKDEGLLATIKIPKHMRNLDLPSPTYGKKPEIIKPLEERLHVKKGAPLKKGLPRISSPEMQVLADDDWWYPNGGEDDEPETLEIESKKVTEPKVTRFLGPKHGKRAPRRLKASTKHRRRESRNPRFRRI
jgi:NIMA (never in mitosis gene a)-related kinase